MLCGRLADDVMGDFAARLGPEFGASICNYQGDLWQRCCRLFRFEVDADGPTLGPKGTESLIENGRTWIAREFVRARLTEVMFTSEELVNGFARREVWRTQCLCGAEARMFYRPRHDYTPEVNGGERTVPQVEDFDPDDFQNMGVQSSCCHGLSLKVTPVAFEDRFRVLVSRRGHMG